MRTQTCREIEIEDLLGHPAEMVEDLRAELSDCFPSAQSLRVEETECSKITSDPKRAGFYEVQSGGTTYYIHVIPSTGKVLLLAAWPTA
jgi:hypothetical protein